MTASSQNKSTFHTFLCQGGSRAAFLLSGASSVVNLRPLRCLCAALCVAMVLPLCCPYVVLVLPLCSPLRGTLYCPSVALVLALFPTCVALVGHLCCPWVALCVARNAAPALSCAVPVLPLHHLCIALSALVLPLRRP